MTPMILNWLDRLGDYNPQLFRELKGHLRWRSLTIAGAISLVGQLLTLIYFAGKLPAIPEFDKFNRYCTGKPEYEHSERLTCLLNPAGDFTLNWQLWWLDVFNCLSIISVMTLLLLGAHLLVTDLAREERRGTLNFLRLTPRSTASILLGKLLGVPALLYLVAFSVLPLHLGAGLAASIPLGYILAWYGVVGAIALMIYSAALVFGLSTSWLGGFQPWLGSLANFMLLSLASCRTPTGSASDFFGLLSPLTLLPYLIPPDLLQFTNLTAGNVRYQLEGLNRMEWMGLPIGNNGIVLSTVMVLNAGVWTYWCWQMILRQFRNPSGNLISKRHSYLIVLCFEAILLGLSTTQEFGYNYGQSSFQEVVVLNLIFCLWLIAVLTPGLQTLYDWARYRHTMPDGDLAGKRHRVGLRSLLQDLLWGEKSPALLAIALNFAIVGTMLTIWCVAIYLNANWAGYSTITSLDGCIATTWLMLGMLLLCAAIAQRLLLMQTTKRTYWAMGTVGAVVILPPVILSMLSVSPVKQAGLWALTAMPWVAFEHLSVVTAVLAAIGQLAATSLAIGTIQRQLRQAGASSLGTAGQLVKPNPSTP